MTGKRAVLLTAFLWIPMNLSCGDDYVPYVPIDLDPGRGDPFFVRSAELLTARHALAIQVILEEYEEPYEIRDGVVYIPRALHKDEDTLYNYTEKAYELSDDEISDWLKKKAGRTQESRRGL